METQVPDPPGKVKMVQLDHTDPKFEELCKSADRIANLLSSPKCQANPSLVGALDDLLGAVYALIFARENDFEDRAAKPIEPNVLLTRAGDLAKGKVRTDGKWIAGFHFNSALFRISAIYHRFLKIAVGRDDEVGTLRPLAETLYRQWTSKNWCNTNVRAVHGQVTDLKHAPRGTYDHRRANAGFRNAVLSVGELLDLIEAWN